MDVDPNNNVSKQGNLSNYEPDLQKLLTEHSNNIEAKKYSEKLNLMQTMSFWHCLPILMKQPMALTLQL